MKIGVLTIHDTFSIGATLQAYALCRKLSEMGHEPELIAYSPEYLYSIYDARVIGIQEDLKSTVRSFFAYKRNAEMKKKFIEFKERFHPPMTTRYYRKEEVKQNPPQVDAYVCGSDQIWNPEHIMYDDTFFCGFEKRLVPKVAYAASIGLDELEEKDVAFLKRHCKNMTAIGVREDTAVTQLWEMGFSAVQNIDPTLLYDRDVWKELEVPVTQKLPSKYILYYPLSENSIEYELLPLVKAYTGLPCVVISPSLRGYKHADYQICCAGPQEYLYLFDNAEVVFTNSFHALSFSIIFKKKSVLYEHKTRNSRLESLLRLVNLEERLVRTVEEFKVKDWKTIWRKGYIGCKEIIWKEQKQADIYLKEALSECK